MKRSILLALGAGISAVTAFAAEPFVKYDFTGQTIQCSGTVKEQPVFREDPVIFVGKDGKFALGLRKKGYAEVPGGDKFDASNGLTIVCKMTFPKPSKDANGKQTYDMIVFKNNEFLIGRAADKLYFNFAIDGKWAVKGASPDLPAVGTPVVAAATVEVQDGQYIYKVFVNGKLCTQGALNGKFKPSASPLRIGRGWGSQWDAYANVAEVAIYPAAMSEAEIAQIK